MPAKLPKEFRNLLASITAKRPKTVIDHILKHGHITTEELQNTYGYEHPPRAARDVREKGVPLETFTVTNAQGRKIAAYRFGDVSKIRGGILAGRKVFAKDFKKKIADCNGRRCGICFTNMELRYLQVDHRIPFEVGGEGEGERTTNAYMLICGSCNRAKSWSCEHCPNWIKDHNTNTCKSCYWASPEEYIHIATLELRRLDVTWNHTEVADYDALAQSAKDANMLVGDYVKMLVNNHKFE
ncbi:MAG: HNH endonuclease [Pirellulaceae bacterium]